MEPGELADINATGRFNASPYGGEIKSFWGSLEDAQSYVGQLEGKTGFESPFTVVKTSVNPSMVNGPITMDGMPAYTVNMGNFGNLAPPEIIH